MAELESLLDGNTDAQRRYLRYLGLHTELQDSGTVTSIPRASTAPRPLWQMGLVGLAAAALLMVAGTVQESCSGFIVW